jgi:hypothetical protein
MKQMGNPLIILIGNIKERVYLENLGINERIL